MTTTGSIYLLQFCVSLFCSLLLFCSVFVPSLYTVLHSYIVDGNVVMNTFYMKHLCTVLFILITTLLQALFLYVAIFHSLLLLLFCLVLLFYLLLLRLCLRLCLHHSFLCPPYCMKYEALFTYGTVCVDNNFPGPVWILRVPYCTVISVLCFMMYTSGLDQNLFQQNR